MARASRDPEISPPDYVAAMPYGIFYDTMIHDFDMVRWLLADEPLEIYARTACMLDAKENPHRDPDTASAGKLYSALSPWAPDWSGGHTRPAADGRFSGPSGAGRLVLAGTRVDLVLADDGPTVDRVNTALGD